MIFFVEKKYEKLRKYIKYNRPSARRGLETRLFQGFVSQNLAVRPYLKFSGFGKWLSKRKKNLKGS